VLVFWECKSCLVICSDCVLSHGDTICDKSLSRGREMTTTLPASKYVSEMFVIHFCILVCRWDSTRFVTFFSDWICRWGSAAFNIIISNINIWPEEVKYVNTIRRSISMVYLCTTYFSFTASLLLSVRLCYEWPRNIFTNRTRSRAHTHTHTHTPLSPITSLFCALNNLLMLWNNISFLCIKSVLRRCNYSESKFLSGPVYSAWPTVQAFVRLIHLVPWQLWQVQSTVLSYLSDLPRLSSVARGLS